MLAQITLFIWIIIFYESVSKYLIKLLYYDIHSYFILNKLRFSDYYKLKGEYKS